MGIKKCQCYYCKNGLIPPEEEEQIRQSMEDINAGRYREYTIDELIEEI